MCRLRAEKQYEKIAKEFVAHEMRRRRLEMARYLRWIKHGILPKQKAK